MCALKNTFGKYLHPELPPPLTTGTAGFLTRQHTNNGRACESPVRPLFARFRGGGGWGLNARDTRPYGLSNSLSPTTGIINKIKLQRRNNFSYIAISRRRHPSTNHLYPIPIHAQTSFISYFRQTIAANICNIFYNV